jgi:hypothetical protein
VKAGTEIPEGSSRRKADFSLLDKKLSEKLLIFYSI